MHILDIPHVFLPEDGDGVNCDISTGIPDFTPSRVFSGNNGIIYIKSTWYRYDNGVEWFNGHRYGSNVIFRWDSKNKAHLDPIRIGSFPFVEPWAHLYDVVYIKDQDRFYFEYNNGEITTIPADKSSPEQLFTFNGRNVSEMSNGGNFLFAVYAIEDDCVAYTFSFNGVEKDKKIIENRDCSHSNNDPERTAWNSVKGISYHLGSYSDVFIESRKIDQVTGKISDYKIYRPLGGSSLQGPLRVSQDGNSIVVGSGQIFDARTLDLDTSIPGDFKDAVWTEDGGIITVREQNGATLVEYFNNEFKKVKTETIPDVPVSIQYVEGKYVVITRVNYQKTAFHILGEN